MERLPYTRTVRAGSIACLLWWAMASGPVSSAPAVDPLERGQGLAQQVYDRPAGEDASTRGTMVLTETAREPRVRQMLTYRKDSGDGRMATLIRFIAPADIADTGLLTLDHPDGASDQWVYLPALGTSRRIPSARRGGRVVGSDIFFEDLQDRKVELDQHRWLRSETLEDVPAEVVESVPVDPGNSVYGRRVSWIHPDTAIPLRIDFHAPGAEEPFKRLTVQRIERIQGYWTVTDSLMMDLESGHQTRLINEVTLYDRALPDTLFSHRTLVDPALERPFRP
jgi:hypothetical protein